MDNFEVSKGHKELIGIVLAVFGYALLELGMMARLYGLNWLFSNLIVVLIGLGIGFMLFKGKYWAKTLCLIYMVVKCFISLFIMIGSISKGWVTNGIVYGLFTIVLFLCLFALARSKHIKQYMDAKNMLVS